MKGVVSMIVEVIEKYPLLVIFMLVLLLVMTFVIVYYRMSKKYEKSQIELKESLLAATTLNRCIHALTYHSEIDDAINDLLCLITEFFQGDRAYIFQIDYEQNTTSNLFEYTEEGVTPEINNLQNVSLETVQYWLDRFKVDGTFYIKSLEEEVDKNSETYRLLKLQNITSLIAVPLIENEIITGFLGVDNPRRRCDNSSLLSSVVFFVSESMNRKQQEQKLKTMSYLDSMTHIFNRNALIERIDKIKESQNKDIGIAYFDLNGLKNINDLQGHLEGDAVLKKTAYLINECFPRKAYRFGGDEFVVLSVDVKEASFIKQVEQSKKYLEQNGISCSVGVSWCYNINDVDELIKEADTKMYENKANFYENEMVGIEN